ncbi:MAG: very short patch repair endonuclease, partial [Anaerolineales bacterium]
MSKIKDKNTAPELFVRSMLHRMGYRFRLHVKDLPGKPDIVLPGYDAVIFVHGCFWHQHKGCKYAVMPKTRKEFWEKKLARNVDRDNEVVLQLKRSS